MENNETNPGRQSSRRLSWPMIAGLVVVIALILVGLFLPPISLGTRLGLGGGDNAADVTSADATAPAQRTGMRAILWREPGEPGSENCGGET